MLNVLVRHGNHMRNIDIGKEKAKLSIFTEEIIVPRKSPKNELRKTMRDNH